MSDATAVNSRYSILSIIWTSSLESLAHWPDPGLSSSNGEPAYGPTSFDEIWQALITRHGKQSGTRQMIDLLKLTKEVGRDRLRQAIETALETGCK